jgi:hypothetical protein
MKHKRIKHTCNSSSQYTVAKVKTTPASQTFPCPYYSVVIITLDTAASSIGAGARSVEGKLQLAAAWDRSSGTGGRSTTRSAISRRVIAKLGMLDCLLIDTGNTGLL